MKLRLLLAVLCLLVISACRPQAEHAPLNNITVDWSLDVLAVRPSYQLSRPFRDLLKPHFYARTDLKGDVNGWSRPDNLPEEIVEQGGKVKLRFRQGRSDTYLDLLALESQMLGEHPVHKVYRLKAMGAPVERSLARRLEQQPFPHYLFHSLQFEYLPGKESSGVVAEVFPDGTFLVIPYTLPEEWRSPEAGVSAPSHLHVNARALSVKTSESARQFEQEILELPFEEQRYPPAELARQDCQTYLESLKDLEYAGLLEAVGYRFTPEHVSASADAANPLPFVGEVNALLRSGAGSNVEYFGFEGEWVTQLLVQRGTPWLQECDAAGGIRRYSAVPGGPQDNYYITVRRSLEPDKKQRYKILALSSDGAAQEIYTAPGIMLVALPLPSDPSRWLLSSEGWPGPKDGAPADPRWQSVYLAKVAQPDDYAEVHYPLEGFPKAPSEGLYGASAALSADGRFLFNTLYGFKDEGGGLWVVDLARPDFANAPAAYRRIMEWDHALSWVVLERQPAAGSATTLWVFLTGKEVADDFAMTANLARLRSDGLDSAVEQRERLRRMVGWNPVPFGWQKTGDHQFLVAVETFFNYESSLLPRALGVYLVPVETSK
ncbi:MAG: hypothetical protein FJ316_06650 [SAR202 cluster bacterium]|nr:hypothetical protein [SAR202 cluster bacterium]